MTHTSLYCDKHRKVGSQSESPGITFYPTHAQFHGYQVYKLYRNGRVLLNDPQLRYASKFRQLLRVLTWLHKTRHYTTMADLGCSNGLACFLGKQAGFQHIWALDHDKPCLQVIQQACQRIGGRHKIHTSPWAFGSPLPDGTEQSVDVLVVGALIHWVYSCTADYGSLDLIVEYLSSLVKHVLLIEWVGPADPAIELGHIRKHKQVHKEPYTRDLFEQALLKHFGFSRVLVKHTPTRWLYMAVRKQEDLVSSTNVVHIRGKPTKPTIQTKPVVHPPRRRRLQRPNPRLIKK
jgi:hypothetical protein